MHYSLLYNFYSHLFKHYEQETDGNYQHTSVLNLNMYVAHVVLPSLPIGAGADTHLWLLQRLLMWERRLIPSFYILICIVLKSACLPTVMFIMKLHLVFGT